MTLKQRKLFIKKELIIQNQKLKLISKNLINSEEFLIDLEEIDTSRMVFQQKTDVLMVGVTVLFGSFFLINLFNPENYKSSEDDPFGVIIFLFVVSCISALITFINSKNVVKVPTIHNEYIEIFRLRPNREEVDDFISKLSAEINNTLLSKYGNVDLDMPIEPQLMNINWLKERNVISEEEFEQKKSELLTGIKFRTNL